jgi:phage-related protein
MNLEVKMRLRLVGKGKWRILAVCRSRGDCPLLELLAELPPNLAKEGRQIQALLHRMQVHGPPRNVELSHQVGPGLWQLARGRLRILWFYGDDRAIVLTHGFVKRSRKTPAAEIARTAESRSRYETARAAGTLIVEENW